LIEESEDELEMSPSMLKELAWHNIGKPTGELGTQWNNWFERLKLIKREGTLGKR